MDILEILKQFGLELAPEKVDEFNKSFRTAYKSQAELTKYTDKVKALETELSTTKGELDTVKTELTSVSAAKSTFESELTALKQAQQEESSKALYDNALKGVEFVSERVKKSIIDEMKSKNFEVKDNTLSGVETYLQELYTSDKALFKTVDASIHTWGAASENNGGGAGDGKKVNTNVFGKLI